MKGKMFSVIVLSVITHLSVWGQYGLPWGNTGTALPNVEISPDLFSGPKLDVPCSITFLHSNYNPGNTFGADVSVFNVSVTDVTLTYVDPEGYSWKLTIDEDYVSFPYRLVVYKELAPGSQLILTDDYGKTLAKGKIPKKGTAAFDAFVEKINRIGSNGSSGTSGLDFSNNGFGLSDVDGQGGSGRSRTSIEADLRKAYELLHDMERYRDNARLMTQKSQYDVMIVKQRETIQRLEQELRNAR